MKMFTQNGVPAAVSSFSVGSQLRPAQSRRYRRLLVTFVHMRRRRR